MMGSSNKPRILGSKICEPVLPKTCEKKQISKERSSVSKLVSLTKVKATNPVIQQLYPPSPKIENKSAAAMNFAFTQ